MKDINTICFWLIDKCLKTGAFTMTIKQEAVHKLDEQLGDWEIIVRKIKEPLK